MTDPTDLIALADAALNGVTPDRCYLIKEAGIYYRPNFRGYTTSATQAGRYTLDEAIKESHPNGPDGPRDGLTYQHENDARDDDWLIVRELRQLVPALRDALAAALTRAEAAECRAEALVAERDKANAEWAEAQSAATYNAEYVDLALEMRARVAVLEAALQPFADAADELDELGMDDPNQQAPVTYDDCVAARAALTGESQR